MENHHLKYENVLGASAAYIKSVEYYEYLEKTTQTTSDHFSHDDLLDGARRSLIQAFEIMIEVFWKYLKWLLEKRFDITLDIINPRNTITKACEIRLISENDTTLLLRLINLRNQTSHIYQEELVLTIAHQLCQAQKQIEALIEKCNDKNFTR